jgi:hypothetical protein
MATEAQWASMGRELAKTLMRFARDRDDRDKKEIAAQHTTICAEYRRELDEQFRNPNPEGGGDRPE